MGRRVGGRPAGRAWPEGDDAVDAGRATRCRAAVGARRARHGDAHLRRSGQRASAGHDELLQRAALLPQLPHEPVLQHGSVGLLGGVLAGAAAARFARHRARVLQALVAALARAEAIPRMACVLVGSAQDRRSVEPVVRRRSGADRGVVLHRGGWHRADLSGSAALERRSRAAAARRRVVARAL